MSTTVRVTDFGADPTGRTDSAAAVRDAVRHAKTLTGDVRIVFPRGTYALYPEDAEQRELYLSNTVGADPRHRDKRIAVLIEDMSDVVVDGDRSTLLLHGLPMAFAAIRAHRVTFTDFTFDYAPPRVVDLTVVATGVRDGRAYREVSVPDGFRHVVDGGHVTWLGEDSPTTGQPYWSGQDGLTYCQFYDPDRQISQRCPNPLFDDVAAVTDLGAGRIRIEHTHDQAPTDAGLVYSIREDTRDTAAALFWESSDITVSGVTGHHLHGFGLLGQLSRDITVQGCTFAPPAGSGRHTAGFADFLQMSGVGGRVVVRDTVFDGAHDDAINIHGTYLEVQRRSDDGRTLTLAYRHHQTAGFPQFYPGDAVVVLDRTTMVALPDGERRVVAVTGPSGRDHDRDLSTMTVTVDAPLPAEVVGPDHLVENLTYTPEVLVTGCTFKNLATRGVLVSTPRPVVIEDNVFEAPQMPSVLICSDASFWYESGSVTDLVIRRNRFVRPASPVIQVLPTVAQPDPDRPVHRGIRVEHNDVELADGQLVHATAVRDLTVTGNRIRRPEGSTRPVEVVLRGCSQVRLADNVDDLGSTLAVVLDRTRPEDVVGEPAPV